MNTLLTEKDIRLIITGIVCENTGMGIKDKDFNMEKAKVASKIGHDIMKFLNKYDLLKINH